MMAMRGRNVACWCAPGGDAYLELANADWQCEPLARG